MMSQQPQQQQQQPSQQYSVSQPQPTTSAAQEEEEEEEEEEFRRLWIGDLQHWMDEEEEVRTLWIGDLQHWMDEAYIDYCFSHTGEVFTSKVIRNKKTTTECYGFIEFKSHAIAERFLHKFNGTPMPRVAVGTNFSLNWASSSSFGSGGEKQQRQEEEEDDCASDIVTTDFMLPQETFSSVKHLDCATQFYNEKVNSSWEDMLKWNSSWEDMLKWWSIAQGTRTPQAVHAAHRVYMIGAIFKTRHHVLPATIIEESLDDLPLYVDFIDIAKELHSIDALDPILGKLYSEDAGIRAKAAKLINSMAKKNHSSRQLVMEASREGLIYNTYFAERNPTVQSNALDAISSLFSNNKPGLYADLINVFENESVNRQRKALNLIAHLVEEHNSNYNIVTVLEYPSIMMRLASSVDAVVRKAALKCLIVLARVENFGNSGQVVKNDDKLKHVLQERIEVISAMAPEDLGAAREEIQLVDSLWNACYNEPSSLRENGLLVLPGDDTPASDVAQAI